MLLCLFVESVRGSRGKGEVYERELRRFMEDVARVLPRKWFDCGIKTS